MPTYEYRCPEGHTFDRFAKMSEAAAELPCPTCGKVAVRQVSGGAGLVFKGSGFYLTDYGKNAHRTGTDGRPASGSKHEAGESSSSESTSGEAKSSDAKSSDAKSGEAKPTAADAGSPSTPAVAPKSGTESAKSGSSSAGEKSSSKKSKP